MQKKAKINIFYPLLIHLAIFLLSAGDALANSSGNEDFIDFLKMVSKRLVMIVIYFSILVGGPYCLLKGFVLLSGVRESGQQSSPVTYIAVGICLVTLPILVAVFIKTIRSTGPFGQSLADLLLEYLP